MKVLIIEDELIVADYIKGILENNNYEVVMLADDLKSTLEGLKKKPDVCLVDIRLANDESGIDIGSKLKKLGIPFLYLTANNEIPTIQKAAITEPEAYLTKPFNERDVIAALELIRIKISKKQIIHLHTNKGKIELPISQILYLEADNVYTKIVTEDRIYTERITLKSIENLLDSNFVRVHRSFIVNKSKIDSKSASKIHIQDYVIPVSRSFKVF